MASSEKPVVSNEMRDQFLIELPPKGSLEYKRLQRRFNVHSRDDIECLSKDVLFFVFFRVVCMRLFSFIC